MSPILVGPLLLVETFHWLFAGTAVGFIVSAVMVSAIIFPFKGQVKVQYHFSKKWRIAVLFIKGLQLPGILCLYFGVAAATAIILVNTIVYFKGVMRLGDTEVVLFFAVSGIGLMSVAFILLQLLFWIKPRKVMIAGPCLMLVNLTAKSLTQCMTSGLLVWLLLGVVAFIVQTPSVLSLKSLLQTRSPYCLRCTFCTDPCLLIARIFFDQRGWSPIGDFCYFFDCNSNHGCWASYCG